jgi:anthranilate phosphoribosyltransferase
MTKILQATKDLLKGENLPSAVMGQVMEEIMTGACNDQAIANFLDALSRKGETVEEITAASTVMRTHVIKINTCRQPLLDTCGTGGDGGGTFNISTAVALVAAGCGIFVAKHGNRCVSSCSGSADVLEELGVNIALNSAQMEECLEGLGIAFLFAQALHPAMKFAMPARRMLGKRTIFNVLGPLSNPASATHQLVGVYENRWTEKVALVLRNLGSKHALVCHGSEGLDEFTLSGPTNVSELKNDRITNYEIAPEDLGLKRMETLNFKCSSAKESADTVLRILKGDKLPARSIVVLNSAAAIYAADKTNSIEEAIPLAEESIDSGKAFKKLEELRNFTGNLRRSV